MISGQNKKNKKIICKTLKNESRLDARKEIEEDVKRLMKEYEGTLRRLGQE